MSKKTGVISGDQQPDDVVVVGFSPAVAQAGAWQQAASAQAVAMVNETLSTQLQDTQSLATCSTGTTQALSAGSLKTSQRLHRAITTIQALKQTEPELSEL